MEQFDRQTSTDPRKLQAVPIDSVRPRCLVADLEPERGLSRTLCQHLELELDSLEFSSDELGRFDSIWVCGYEPSQAERLRELRIRFPDSRILVTGGRLSPEWQSAALDSGADDVRQWPLSRKMLQSLLLGNNR